MNQNLPPSYWDERVLKFNGGILQSRPWAEFQQALGRQTFWAQGDDWAWLGTLRLSHGLRYLLSGYGPVAQNRDAVDRAIESIVAAGKELSTDFVRIEPQSYAEAAEAAGARRIGELDPEHTLVLDLKQTEEELRKGLASGHRNLINGTSRRGIVIRQTDAPADFEVFLKMLEDTAQRSRVSFYPESYYRQLQQVLMPLGVARLYMAEAEGQMVASALFYDWGHTRYYAHAGAYQALNRRVKASVSLVWQAVLDAKEEGLTQFDLWGVAPEGQPHHRLAGVSQFKRAFGGETIDFAGTWDIPIKKSKYRAYSLYRRLRRMD